MSPYIIHDYFCNREKEASEEKDVVVPAESNDVKDDETSKNLEESHCNDVDKKLLNAAKILERMLNLNTYEDVARDFRSSCYNN